MRNGLIDGTKCQSSEWKRNLFQLLCIAHTTNGSCVMKRSLSLSDTKRKQYIEFLRLYLGMEDWFHDSNNKKGVINAQPQIAKVLWSLQHFFPQIQTPIATIFQRCMELLKCRSIWCYLEVELTFMVDLVNQHTSNLLKYQDRKLNKESVSLHSRLHFNATPCKFQVILCTSVRSNPIFTNNQEILKQIWTLQNQKETFSLKCQETMISELLVNWLKWRKQNAK